MFQSSEYLLVVYFGLALDDRHVVEVGVAFFEASDLLSVDVE